MNNLFRIFKITGLTLFIASTCLLSTQVNAALVTIEASGETNLVSQPALNSLLGLTFSATAVYDTTVADANPNPDFGEYGAGLVSFTATLDGQTLTTPSPDSSRMVVTNDSATFNDNFSIGSFSTGLALSFPGLGPYESATVNLVLRDTSSSIFSNDELPASFDLMDFDLPFLSVILQPQTNNLNTRIDATINSLTVSSIPNAVPVPAAVWLFGTAMAGLIGFSRRRQAT